MRVQISIAAITLAAVAALSSSCKKAPAPEAAPSPTADAAPVRDAVTQALEQAIDARWAAMRDFTLEGTMLDVPSGDALTFSYAQQQPRSLSVDLFSKGAKTRSFVCDGTTLMAVDHVNKKAMRKSLKGDEQTALLAIHDVFANFTVEGWRPPLLRRSGVVGKDNGDTGITLRIAIDGGDATHQELQFHRDGRFIKKTMLGKDDKQLTQTRITAEETDAESKLQVPTAWEDDVDGHITRTTLQSFTINKGVNAARFLTRAPAGYDEVNE